MNERRMRPSPMKKWIAGLIITSLALPAAVLGASDGDLRRALNSSSIDEFGFYDKIMACNAMSSFLVKRFKMDTEDIFVADESKTKWNKLRFQYIENVLGLRGEEMYTLLERMESPLVRSLIKYFADIYSSKASLKNEDFSECVTAYKIFLDQAESKISESIGSSSPPKSLSTTSNLAAQSNPSYKKTDQKSNHAQCLEARDYEGCMRVKSSGGPSAPVGDKCTARGACQVTTKGTDSFGLPKPMGWFYMDDGDGSRIIYFSKFHRVPHKGQPTRYVGVKRITRYYQNPKAGTSGTVIGGGTGFTNCTGYGSSINCTTTGGGSRYIPGQSATPGGVKNARFDSVYDCKDDTHANYEGTRIMYGGWTKNSKSSWAKLLKGVCDRGPDYIMKLDTMNVQM